MIPLFPKFKNLEITDREDILQFTKSFSPYSDFDFGSMWSWNYTNSMSISQLNGNLVVKFSDYTTEDYFYSFIGSNQLDETAKILLIHAKDNKLIEKLKLVPQVVAHNLNRDIFSIDEDIDNHDYVLETVKLATLDGPELASKRRATNIFIRRHGQLTIREIDPTDEVVQRDIMSLLETWIKNKINAGAESNDHERIAVTRCLEHAGELDLFSAGMYNESKLIAFWIIGLRDNECSISHFEKADTENFEGIFPYFKSGVAKILLERKDIKFINLEQDLGIAGLRQSKQAYKPTRTLQKFTVSLS